MVIGCWRLFLLGFSWHRQQTFFPPKIEKSALFSCQTLCYVCVMWYVVCSKKTSTTNSISQIVLYQISSHTTIIICVGCLGWWSDATTKIYHNVCNCRIIIPAGLVHCCIFHHNHFITVHQESSCSNIFFIFSPQVKVFRTILFSPYTSARTTARSCIFRQQ